MSADSFFVIEKSASGTYSLPIESILFEKRIIFLSGEISHPVAERFVKQIMHLSLGEHKNEDVLIVINSPGGEISAGLGILSAIWSVPFKVNVLCTMECYSMAAVIFSGTTGSRTMTPHAKLMFHEPLISKQGSSQTPLSVLEEEGRSLRKNREMLKDVLKRRAGVSKEELSKLFGKDVFFNANQAVEKRLCDKITKEGEPWIQE